MQQGSIGSLTRTKAAQYDQQEKWEAHETCNNGGPVPVKVARAVKLAA